MPSERVLRHSAGWPRWLLMVPKTMCPGGTAALQHTFQAQLVLESKQLTLFTLYFFISRSSESSGFCKPNLYNLFSPLMLG